MSRSRPPESEMRLAPGHQFYVTHCLPGDSVLNNPGYSLRAASCRDLALATTAFHFPPYELPLPMWKNPPSKTDKAPTRLARIEDRNGVWAIKTSYLSKDTIGRDRSYFSHLVLLPAATPIDVLVSWGASEWVKSYPPGATKWLPRMTKLPVGNSINDAALTAFLGNGLYGLTALGLTVSPPRLRPNKVWRRRIFGRILLALLQMSSAKSRTSRRIYVHAEPGLVALLLYGAVRLLPASVTENLTFTTYEPYHCIRDYEQSAVVGTFLGANEETIDIDLLASRGVVIDSFGEESTSSSLRGDLQDSLPRGLVELMRLAVAGNWKLLTEVKQAIGGDLDSLERVAETIISHRQAALLSSKFAEEIPECPKCKRQTSGSRYCVVCDVDF